ncbi:uncharacterized protein WCC33_011668 [Rhinophrynus dorsalis]
MTAAIDRTTLVTHTDPTLPVSERVESSDHFPISPEKPSQITLIDELTEVGSVRLVNGGGRCAGRVEVFYSDAWGTVCDDLWSMENAQVICRQLNCGDAISMNGNGFSGAGTGPIWLDNVKCNGNEKALKDCDSSPWGLYECNHEEGAGVVCSGNLNAGPLTTREDMIASNDRNTLHMHTTPSLPVSVHLEKWTGTDTSKGPLLDHTTQMEHDRATPTQPQREDKINSSRTEEKQCNRGLPEGTQQQSDCFCKVQMIACESHQYPELIQVLKEMRSDFSSFSSAFQEEKADFRSIASNLEQLTSAVQQLSVSLQLMLSHSNTGGKYYKLSTTISELEVIKIWHTRIIA